LITSFRNYAKERRRMPVNERIAKWVAGATLPHPTRFRLSASAGSFAKSFTSFIPKKFSAMLEMLPESIPPTRPLPEVFPAKGKRRARVALLAGCVQQVLAPEINWATLRVLANSGIEVLIPPGQICCGALAIHTGEFEQASEFAIHNLQTFPRDVDAILTNAAGCGSGMHEYPLLFQGDDLVVEIDSFSKQVQDVCQFLDDLGLYQPLSLPEPIKIAYQDACHLAHAQGITTAPRHLLEQISNLTLLTIPEGELCCGSAGTYNVEHPEIATALGRRKVENILSIGAQTVVSGNIGCMIQMRKHFIELGRKIPVLHTMELLDQASKISNIA
jgi:glycolate oxidase iron-sulfur subunit